MTSPRARRPFVGDLRFLIGVGLVLVSILGVWLLVSGSRHTTPVLQATRTIVPGEAISSADFQIVEVGLAGLTDNYLAPQDVTDEAVATRTLPKGELVPRSAVGTQRDVRSTTVVVASTTIPADVQVGSVVELWYAPLKEDGRSLDVPRVLVGDAVVSRVAEAEGMLSQSRTDVEVVINRSETAEVLAAITGGATLSIIPSGVAP